MANIRKISGFPEWLPEEQIIEQNLIEKIRSVYESHGFAAMETPSVELLETLVGQGVVEKEIYALRRVQASPDEEKLQLALHFDLTVPFARYVAVHYDKLTFPFRRYCLQKVWRGDRPQKGRFREFYQFDIDIVTRDEVPLSCDAEVVTVLDKAYRTINIGEHVIKLNNRKILLGFYNSLGLTLDRQKEALIVVDKLDKIGSDGVRSELKQVLGLSEDVTEQILHFATIKVPGADAINALSSLGISDKLFEDGVHEMERVLELIPPQSLPRIRLDLSLARGLAYYTGTIIEVVFPQFPEFGSAGGGGRYENLTGNFIKNKLPAVGASIGITRLMSLILEHNLVPIERKCPSQALVAVYNESTRADSNKIAEELRALGVSCEVFYKAPKLGKQIEYAVSKGIRYVFFPNPETRSLEVKDLSSTEQEGVLDISVWVSKTRNAGQLER